MTEFNIIAYLIENMTRDVSYREIYDIVHGEGFMAGEGDIGFRTNVRAFTSSASVRSSVTWIPASRGSRIIPGLAIGGCGWA